MITAVALQSLSLIGQAETLPINVNHEEFYSHAIKLATIVEAISSVDLSTIYALILRAVYMKYQGPHPERHKRARFASRDARWALTQAIFQVQVGDCVAIVA